MSRFTQNKWKYSTIGLLAILAAGFSFPQVFASTEFVAEVKGKVTRPDGCPDGATACGKATIEGFGSAQYLFFITGFAPISDSCGEYTAIVTFTLVDDSTLTLDEVGTVCGPGNSFFSTTGSSWGNPIDGSGAWTVQDGTGQFAGMTGSGTDEFEQAGANLKAIYTGTLEG
ncbi:MAG: hypothetical protein ACRD5H_17960 [Nitrososphaerales archaeon]